MRAYVPSRNSLYSLASILAALFAIGASAAPQSTKQTLDHLTARTSLGEARRPITR